MFHRKRHPQEMGEVEVAAFLSYLATDRNVAPATQNQALNALVFLYRHVLQRPLGEIPRVVRATKHTKLPVVLTPAEVARVLSLLSGVSWLVACLQYGSGLRLMESVRLRVKDLDFAHRAIYVRHGKGAKDRVVTLPPVQAGPWTGGKPAEGVREERGPWAARAACRPLGARPDESVRHIPLEWRFRPAHVTGLVHVEASWP